MKENLKMMNMMEMGQYIIKMVLIMKGNLIRVKEMEKE